MGSPNVGNWTYCFQHQRGKTQQHYSNWGYEEWWRWRHQRHLGKGSHPVELSLIQTLDKEVLAAQDQTTMSLLFSNPSEFRMAKGIRSDSLLATELDTVESLWNPIPTIPLSWSASTTVEFVTNPGIKIRRLAQIKSHKSSTPTHSLTRQRQSTHFYLLPRNKTIRNCIRTPDIQSLKRRLQTKIHTCTITETLAKSRQIVIDSLESGTTIAQRVLRKWLASVSLTLRRDHPKIRRSSIEHKPKIDATNLHQNVIRPVY